MPILYQDNLSNKGNKDNASRMQRKLISIAETKLILCKDTELSLKHKVFFTNLCEKPIGMSQRLLLFIGNLQEQKINIAAR